MTLLGGLERVIDSERVQTLQVTGECQVLGEAGGAILDLGGHRVGAGEVCGLVRGRLLCQRGALQKVETSRNGSNDQGTREGLWKCPYHGRFSYCSKVSRSNSKATAQHPCFDQSSGKDFPESNNGQGATCPPWPIAIRNQPHEPLCPKRVKGGAASARKQKYRHHRKSGCPQNARCPWWDCFHRHRPGAYHER